MPKRCKQCKTEIVDPTPWRKPFCSYQCGIDFVRAKQNEKRAKAYRKETRAKKEALKTKSQLLKEAQYEFNRYIRLRDEGQPCISCGKTGEGQYHAGHYKTVGACPELRFSEINCFLQCAPCNNHLSGNLIEYRKRLIVTIGQDKVEWLEGPHQTQNLTHEDIRDIKQYYKDKIKVLKECTA